MITDIKKALNKVKSINWKSKFKNVDVNSFEAINSLFFDIIPLFLIPNKVYNFSELNSLKFYRVRPHNQIENYKNYQVYSYPRKKELVKNNRANIKGVPVFYSSIHPKTTIIEYVKNQIQIKDSYLFSLSVWEMKCDREILVTTLINEKNSNEFIKSFTNNVVKSFVKHVQENFTKQEAVFIIELHNYMVNSFCLKNNHIFSSYIAHKQLYQSKKKTDILFYPSIAQNKNSMNMAVNKDFADKFLKLKRVYLVKSNPSDIEKPIFLGKVLFFENNSFQKEIIISNKLEMMSILHIDFKDSIT